MRARGQHINDTSPSVVMARALSHPMRVRILMRMHAPIQPISPKQFSDESGETLGKCSYHFRELENAGCIRVIDEIQRRGATEHIYSPVKRVLAWTREWELLGSVVKQNLAATALSGAVELIGEAVDKGTFEALPDSILAWDAIEVDIEGWSKAHAIIAKAVSELIKLGDSCKDRVAGLPADKTFLVSYLLSTFESPQPQTTD